MPFASISHPDYKIALFLHILAVVLAFGPTFGYAFFFSVAPQYPRGDPGDSRRRAAGRPVPGQPRDGRRCCSPGIYLLSPATAPGTSSDVFISVGFLAIIVLFGLQHALLPARRRARRRSWPSAICRAGRHAQPRVRSDRRSGSAKSAPSPGSIVVVTIFFMTYKPFLWAPPAYELDRRAAGRDVRLRGRRAHGPARVPGLAAARRTSSTSATRAKFPYGHKDADELRERIAQIAELLLDRGAKLLVIACNSATSVGADVAREVAARARGGGGAGGRARRPRSPRRSPTAAGSACWRRRTRSRAAPTAARSKRRAAALEVTEVEAPDLAPFIQHGSPFDEERDGDGPRLLRAAEAGRGRHPDPRLHPLPAGGADAAADPRPRRSPGQRRPRGRRRRPAHPRAAPASPASRDGEGAYRFLCTGDADAFRELGTRFLQMPLGEVERVEIGGLSFRAPFGSKLAHLRATRASRSATIRPCPLLPLGNTVYTHPVAKVMISIPDDLLERLDARARGAARPAAASCSASPSGSWSVPRARSPQGGRAVCSDPPVDFGGDAAQLIREDRESH